MQVRRIHKQHNSCVVTVPKEVLRHLEAKRGDYLAFENHIENGIVTMTKVVTGDNKSANNKSDSGKQDKVRRARAKV